MSDSLSRYEQETIINFNEEEQTASVYTFRPSIKRKLQQLAADRPEECKLYRSQACGSEEYIIPKKWIKISPPRITKMTEEQREFRRLKMKELRAKQLGRI